MQTSNKPTSNKPTSSKPTSSKPTQAATQAATQAPAKVPAPFGTRGAPAGQGAAQALPATLANTPQWQTLVQVHPQLAAVAKPGSINAFYVALAAQPVTLAALHAALASHPQYTAKARATNPKNLQTRVLQACTVYGVLVPVAGQGKGALAPVPFNP